ncbi:MAG: hypothetical protein GXP13_04490 [Gammaproteobacteria bacterium]|nr:hypothetical protein [Gammaproteobacteria bacterium]
MKKEAGIIILLGVFVSTGSAFADTPMSQKKCSSYTGTDLTNTQTNKNETSAAYSIGKLIGNRLRKKSYENWVAGYLTGYAAVGNKAPGYNNEEIKSRLESYCVKNSNQVLYCCTCYCYSGKII